MARQPHSRRDAHGVLGRVRAGPAVRGDLARWADAIRKGDSPEAVLGYAMAMAEAAERERARQRIEALPGWTVGECCGNLTSAGDCCCESIPAKAILEADALEALGGSDE